MHKSSYIAVFIDCYVTKTFYCLLFLLIINYQAYTSTPWPDIWKWNTSITISNKLSISRYDITPIRNHYESTYIVFPDVIFWEPDSGAIQIGFIASLKRMPRTFRIYEQGMWPPEDLQWKDVKNHFFWRIAGVSSGDTLVAPVLGVPDTLRLAHYSVRDYTIRFSTYIPDSLFPLPNDTSVYDCRILISAEPNKPDSVIHLSESPFYCLKSPVETKYDSLAWYSYKNLSNKPEYVWYTYRLMQLFPTYSTPYSIRWRQLFDTDSLQVLEDITRILCNFKQLHLDEQWTPDFISKEEYLKRCTEAFESYRYYYELKKEGKPIPITL